MIKQDITIAGKTVTLAYCYATEIAFKNLAGQDINDFMPDVAQAINAERMPDVQQTIHLLRAGMAAYYEFVGGDCPISDSDLKNECKPIELGVALGTMLKLRADFYSFSKEEDKIKGKDARKSTKNS